MYVFRFSLPVKLGINYLQLHFKYFNNNNIKIILTRLTTSNSNLICFQYIWHLIRKNNLISNLKFKNLKIIKSINHELYK